MPGPPRTQVPALLVLLPLVALGLTACSDSVEPVGEDPLAGIDELAIYSATIDRLGLLNHTAEANSNLRQAVGWPRGPEDLDLFGNTLVYDPDVGAWAIAQDRPVAPDVIHVVWYQFSSQSVALPLSVRGGVDLTDQSGDGSASRIRVAIADQAGVRLADYLLEAGSAETSAARTDVLRAEGNVGDGSRQLQLTVREEESVSVPTGDKASAHTVNLSEGGFTYAATVDADSTVATGRSTVRFSGTVTVDGVATRLVMDMEERPTVPLSGTGSVTHGGSRIADVVVSGNQMDMVFTRPDGGAFTAAQQSRLGTLVAVLLMPVLSVQTYFS